MGNKWHIYRNLWNLGVLFFGVISENWFNYDQFSKRTSQILSRGDSEMPGQAALGRFERLYEKCLEIQEGTTKNRLQNE